MGGVIDRDLGYRRILGNLLKLHRVPVAVFVGVRANAGAEADGTSLALVAAVNEFGSDDGHVPERSFIRSTLDENRDDYFARVAVAVGKGIDEGLPVMRRELGRVGAKVVGDIQRKIKALRDPPNAPSTIAAKGSDNPLIDTGRLRQAMDFEVRG